MASAFDSAGRVMGRDNKEDFDWIIASMAIIGLLAIMLAVYYTLTS